LCGRLGGPQLREVAGERLELLAGGLGPGLVLLGELGLGFGELAELVLLARLEAAGDQAVVGLAGVERALGADRLVAGAAVGDLVGGSERQLDLPRLECREQSAGASSSTTVVLTDRPPGVALWSAREWVHS
jgi:hypothetical protein